MDKKGIAWLFLIELLAGIFAAFVVVNGAQLWASTDIFIETKIARDSAMVINTAHALSSNIAYEYTTDLSRFALEFKNNEVKVYKVGDIIKPSSIFVTKQNNPIEGTVNSGALELSKSAGIVSISKKENLNKMECPVTPGSKQNIDSIAFLLDPAIGKSPASGDISESEFNRLVALNLARRLTNKDSTRKLDSDEPRSNNWLAKLTPSTDVVLSFHAGNYADDGNTVIAYVVDNSNKAESISLACNMLNSLLERFDHISFVLINKNQLKDDLQILNNDKVSIMLMIGNIRNPGTLADIPRISDLIYSGMRNYYG